MRGHVQYMRGEEREREGTHTVHERREREKRGHVQYMRGEEREREGTHTVHERREREKREG